MGVNQARYQQLPFAVDDPVFRTCAQFSDLFDLPVDDPDRRVAQNSSLIVLGCYPFTILQKQLDRRHLGFPSL